MCGVLWCDLFSRKIKSFNQFAMVSSIESLYLRKLKRKMYIQKEENILPANKTTAQSIPFQFVDLFGVSKRETKLRLFSRYFSRSFFVIRIFHFGGI